MLIVVRWYDDAGFSLEPTHSCENAILSFSESNQNRMQLLTNEFANSA
jgi:hypothetical protein